MTTGVGGSVDVYEGIFQSLVWQPLVDASLASLFVSYPILSNFILKPIVTMIFSKIASILFSMAKLSVDLTAIKLINASHQEAFDSALLNLKVIAHDKGMGSNEFIKAREESKLALSKFTAFLHNS